MKRRSSGLKVSCRIALPFILICTAATYAPGLTWEQAQDRSTAWFRTAEARQVVENVLLYQLPCGGWPKNIDMAQPLSDTAKARLANRTDSATIDNGATYKQLRFLARAYAATKDKPVLISINKGLDFLFASPYDNGGWPIFYPLHGGYYDHIHFNDNSVAGVLMLMADIAEKKPPFEFVDGERQNRAAAAFRKGIDCIVNCQVIVGGKRTSWCAQHDEKTLAPAPARTFEPVSLSGQESVGLVRCLMRVDDPAPEVIEAVQSAADWFEKAKIHGIRVKRVDTPQGRDVVVQNDADAPPIWARFYEIGTNRPIFTGRDRVIRHSLEQIERERRIHYAYYGDWPETLLRKDYPAWAAKWKVKE